MDVKSVLILLFVTVVAVYCKPTKDKTQINDEVYYKKLSDAITSLNKQVANFKDALQNKKRTIVEASKQEVKKDETSSLEDSLKKAVAEDSLKKAKEAKDEVEDEVPPGKDTETPDDFFNDDADFLDEDFDEYEEPVVKKDEELPAQKPKEDELSKPAAVKTASDPVQHHEAGEHLDGDHFHPSAGVEKPSQGKDAPKTKEEIVVPELEEEMDTIDSEEVPELPKEKKEVVNVAAVVRGIRDDIHGITKSFKEMKRDYADALKNDNLDENSRVKFEAVKMDIDDVVTEFNVLKDQFNGKGGEVSDQSLSRADSKDEIKSVLTDMKDQLKDAAAAILELKETARKAKRSEKDQVKTMKKDEQKAETPVVAKKDAKAVVVPKEDTKAVVVPKRDTSDTDDEMARLNTLKEELRDVIHDMKDMRTKLRKEKADQLQKRDEEAKEDDEMRMDDLREELDGIKEEVKNIKEKRTVS